MPRKPKTKKPRRTLAESVRATVLSLSEKRQATFAQSSQLDREVEALAKEVAAELNRLNFPDFDNTARTFAQLTTKDELYFPSSGWIKTKDQQITFARWILALHAPLKS